MLTAFRGKPGSLAVCIPRSRAAGSLWRLWFAHGGAPCSPWQEGLPPYDCWGTGTREGSQLASGHTARYGGRGHSVYARRRHPEEIQELRTYTSGGTKNRNRF